MAYKIKRRIIIAFFIILYIIFLGLKINITLSNSEFIDYNARNAARIENILNLKNDYSFIVVGNARNSIGVFEKKLLPLINSSDADFVVFLGDMLLDGANDKYGALNRTLRKITKPVLFTIGDTEISDGGIKNYFRHIGSPRIFFISGKSEFIFLDTTGYTEEEYQINWLKDLLDNIQNVSRRFVFMNRPPLTETNRESVSENKYRMSTAFRSTLLKIFEKSNVSAVVSSNNGSFNQITRNGVLYVSSGGGGGGTLTHQNRESFFHLTIIDVTDSEITVSVLKPETGDLSGNMNLFDYLWNKIFSWVYVYFLNVILIISLLFFAVYLIYTQLIEKIDYYPEFNESLKKDYPLTIAMFTNNYLPFIGGVPLSIARLKQGLEAKGHTVYIFAPRYGSGNEMKPEKGIIRCSPLFHYKKGELIVPVSNIFSSKIRSEFKKINPDIIHVHHPYWLGRVGKKLAAEYKKPVVFTYHTRLEQYNHYVPVFHRLAGGQVPHILIKFFAGACDAVVAPTKSAKRYLRNLGIGKLIIVQPTGIDMNLYISDKPNILKTKDIDDDKLILFSVFRLSKEKNPYFLLDGIKKLSRLSSVPFKCFIAGTGPEEDTILEYIKDNNMEEYVVMLGKVSPEKIPEYYAGTDIFIFSSQSETQGMVILEAMAGRTPVVAVDSSGISDIVKNGINGYKTPANLDEWIQKIKYLLENKAKRSELGDQALETAGENSIAGMSKNIQDMYYEIIDWKKKHPHQIFIR